MVAAVEPEPEPEPMVAAAEPAAEEYPPLRVLAWEEDVAFELEPEPVPLFEPEHEPEPIVAAVEAEPEPEPMVAVEPEPEPEPMVAAAEPEPEPEPMVAAVEPEPEPEPMAPRPIRPISETILHVPRAVEPQFEAPEPVAAEADDISLAARRAQLDLLGLGDPGEGPLGRERGNVLPYRSSGASVHQAELAARAAAGLPAPGAFWEASAREVAGAMSHVGVQSCGDCGLSLSATARFCRRCGTRQARSA
jgi:ribosomal protein L40E